MCLIDPGDAKTFQRLDRLGRVVNDTLDSVDQFQRPIVAVLQGLGGLAPAAIEDRIRRRDPRRGGGVFFERMMPTRTLIAVRVWVRAIKRISVMDLGI